MPINIFLQKRTIISLFIFIVLITFVHNGSVSLWDQDEAAYAGFARTIIDTDNWLIPEFTWSFIHRKTPLHFWFITLSYKIFGESEFAVRFSSSVFIISTYAMILFWGNRLFNKYVAVFGFIFLSTSLFVPSLAKVAVTDATLLACFTVVGFSLVELFKNKSWWAILTFWIAVAAGVMVKGPAILVFCAVFGFLLLLFHPQRWRLLRLHPWIFIPLAFFPLYYWGNLAYKSDGGVFINWLVDWYILKRINGSVLGQTAPFGAHILLIALFFLPFLVFAVESFFYAAKKIRQEWSIQHYLITWFIAGWLIWEFSPSKLPAYPLAAHPALAMLCGWYVNELITQNKQPSLMLTYAQFILLGLLFLGGSIAAWYLNFSYTIIVVFGLLSITSISIGIKTARSDFQTKGLSLFVINALMIQFVVWGIALPLVDNYKDSSRKVAEKAKSFTSANAKIVIGNSLGEPPSLPFYLGKYFTDIEVNTNLDEIQSIFEVNNHCLLILNQEQFKRLKHPTDLIKVDSVSTLYVDRKGLAQYYLVSKI